VDSRIGEHRLAGARIEQTHEHRVPLHMYLPLSGSRTIGPVP
jgi:hypothetical protein